MKRNSDENELGPPFRAVMLSMLIIFVCATAFCGCVSADGGETSQGVSTWDDLKSKLEDSTTNVVTLGDDITVSDKENDALSITISGNKELNLNGHTINTIPSDTAKTTYNLFIINGDDTSLNITGNGNIINSNTVIKLLHGSVCLDSGNFTIKKGEGFEPPFVQIRGCSTDVESYSNFKLGEKATIITNEDCWGVAMFSHDAKKGNGYGIVADIYGTINGDGGGITPNGVLQPEDLTSQNLPKITIHKGAVINTKQAAVYGAGYGIWTFEEGCNVTGSDALGIKSGKFTIKGGKFTGNGDYCEYPAAWSNGMNEVGAAIQVQSNDDYAGNVELIINGGTFTSVNNSALVSTMPVPTTGANAGKVPKNVFKDITIDTSTTTFNFAEGMKNVDIRVCVDSINNLTTAFESGYNVSLEKDITMKVDDSFTIPVNNNLNISSEDHIITTSNGGVLQGWSTTVRKPTAEKSIDEMLSTGKYYPVFQFNITYINTSASTSETSQIIFGEQNSLKKNTFTNATAEFGGWAETPEGAVKYADEASFTLTEAKDITLYAVWNKVAAPKNNVTANGIKQNETGAIDLNVSTNSVTITKEAPDDTSTKATVELDQGVVNVTIIYDDLTYEVPSSGTTTNITGNISEAEDAIKATYKPIKANATSGATAKVSLLINNISKITSLPILTENINATVANKIKADDANENTIAMISGTSTINENITKVTIVFTIDKGYDTADLIVYHFKDGVKNTTIPISSTDNTGSKLNITITSNYGFSHYALVLKSKPIIPPSSGGGSSSTSDDNYYDEDDSSSSSTTTTPTTPPTVVPKVGTPETVQIIGTDVNFEDNKVINSVKVPEGSSGMITLTPDKDMEIWIPESIDDVYGFDLSCDSEIIGDITVNFVINDYVLDNLGLKPNDVGLRHFENEVWNELETTFTEKDGIYYYSAVTQSLSPFEIFFKEGAAKPVEVEPVTPTEEQPTKSPMPVIGLLAGLGAAVIALRRK